MEKTEGELFWEAVDALEAKGHTHAAAVKAAQILTRKPSESIEEKMWAISFPAGKGRSFYTGTFLTRKEAKIEHAEALGKTWEECEKDGDKVERIAIYNL